MLFPWLNILPRFPYLHPKDKKKSRFFRKKFSYFPPNFWENRNSPPVSTPSYEKLEESPALILFLQGSPLQHDVSSGIIISNQSLVVQRVTRSDAGQYTCHVFNSEGEGVSNEVHLAVKCRKLNSIIRLFPLGGWSWLEHYKHVFIL